MQVIDFTAEVVRNVVSPYTPDELPRRLNAPRKSSVRKGKGQRGGKGGTRASSACIFWSLHRETRRVTDVWVSTTDQPREYYTEEYFSQRWDCVVGNCDRGWLSYPEYTPEAVFGAFIETGFHTPADLVNALHQFAKIDTCGWALPMLGRLGDR